MTRAKRPSGNAAVGRPREHDRAQVMLAVCLSVSEGQLVKHAAEAAGVTAKTIRQWALEDAELGALYARAREEQAHAIAEEALAIADSEAETSEAVARNRLRVDTRKWLASKIAPRLYSERQQLEHTGADGGPIEQQTVYVWRFGNREVRF